MGSRTAKNIGANSLKSKTKDLKPTEGKPAACASQPISNIEWRGADDLKANEYNPNMVLTQELKLLEHSILKNGWLHPILITADGTIIDGFHRWALSRSSKAIRAMTGGRVPCVVLPISEPERMLLTIRINRAKGVHAAVKMSDIIKKLVNTYGYTMPAICEGIGATKDEVELLMAEDVFKALKIPEHQYSKAWYPK